MAPEGRDVFGSLTIEENLMVGTGMHAADGNVPGAVNGVKGCLRLVAIDEPSLGAADCLARVTHEGCYDITIHVLFCRNSWKSFLLQAPSKMICRG